MRHDTWPGVVSAADREWQYDLRHRRGRIGERRMAEWFRRQPKTRFVPGVPGHTTTSSGPDGLVWRVDAKGGVWGSVLLVDNKAIRSRAGTVGHVSAFTPRSLSLSLPRLIAAFAPGGVHARKQGAVEVRRRLCLLLAAARAALASGGPLAVPPGVRLLVTNANGLSTGVRAPGVQFADIAAATRGWEIGPL